MEAASYSRAIYQTFSFGLLNFDSGDLTNFFVPPPRCTGGRVADCHCRATVTFAGATTTPLINIGTAATAAKYATANFGTLASGSAASFATLGGTPYNEALLVFSDINFDRDGVTKVQAQVKAPTGAGHAGTGFLDVLMAWF